MTIIEVLEQVRELLHSKGRITYRMLRLQFNLDDESLAALKDELIQAERVAVDEDGKVLVWADSLASSVQSLGSSFQKNQKAKVPHPQSLAPNTQPPISYTPTHLAERIRAAAVSDGERKTITALFADLKGSTALIEGLDPEEARAIIDPALQLMMDAVHRYEGYVAQALGDGIFALFGAPLAHEDHPQRALYAALRMQEEMRRYSDQSRLKGGIPLQMRVGVNTGEVVVRSIRKDDLHTDYVPVGHSTNLAARMEQMATPGSILITDYTKKLTDGFFDFKTLGAAEIKGMAEPLQVYEVIGVGPLRTRLQVAARRGLTRFVGRYAELEQMRRALEQAKAGHGQIVDVMGEPGLGKSRLFYEFKLLSRSGCLLLEAFSVSHGKASPYLPVFELLKGYCQIQLADDERSRRQKVIGRVLELDRGLEDTLLYLFALLGIEEQPSPLQQMDSQIRRRRTFEALKRLFLRESLNQPLILIFEDLHWIDNETQGFLDVLVESVSSARILLLVNYRPEYRQEWGSKTYYTQLRLAPLDRDESEELLTFLLGTDARLTTLKRLILEKTEGTPFFMEEVVQTLAEEGVLRGKRGSYRLTQHVPTLHLPSTVQGVLAARIDRLAPDEKTLLQQLAVVGREFSLSLIRHVISQSEEDLYRSLSSLQHKEFLYEQLAFPEVEYLFKHALTQEVTYNSVLIERRKMLHERTAQAIEALYSDSLEDHYSELAYHYSRSGNTQKAIDYLQLTGQQAVQRSANAEAINHLTSALELLKTLPDSPDRTRQELALLIALGPALMETRSPAVREAEQVYTRAQELYQHVGETPQLFPVLRGLYTVHLVRGAFRTAHALGEQFLRLAQSIQDPVFLPEAHLVLGQTLFYFGEVSAARHHFEQGIACYDPNQHHSQAFLYGVADPGVFCRTEVAHALWLLGYPNQARQRSQEALSLARNLSHPMSLAFALMHTAWIHIFHREEQIVRELTEALIRLCTDQGFPNLSAHGTVEQGWALAEQGEGEKGVAQIREGLAALRALGVEIARPTYLAWLAEACQRSGQIEEGLSTLDEALEVVGKNEERWYEAELYRLKGTLTLQSQTSLEQVADKSRASQDEPEITAPRPLTPDPQGEAEACFLKAIDIARQQQAKSWELRAVMSLVRLRRQQAQGHATRNTQYEARTKLDEAHAMLSELYHWFTEGFDTKDLQEAKALLESLSL
jgi:predicted ATPase/class 3 adenylate cyclase